ncbi:phosphate-binding protein PstS-like protein [Calothrix sp. NIES-4071]|nr:phosphate-binding protein PstS-like protein [Calothrix sp. NIES-4071]BAZ60276.1 phosphate-binding protein PstS-like protein [Calothrix sp. NIES-4105]
MNKSKTSLNDTREALETAKYSYEEKLRALQSIEQQAHAATASGDEATAKKLMTQAIEVEEQMSVLDSDIKYLEGILNEKPNTKNLNIIPLLLIPLALILGGFGYWYFTQQAPTTATCLASGTKVRINGSTSMVRINKMLKKLIESNCPGSVIETGSSGSDVGIQQLSAGQVDIAAVSRPLNAQEQAKGLVANFVKRDAIAIVVGKQNPFTKGLTTAQVADIFQGKINNWSAVGGTAGTIRVINRPLVSGTRHAFHELVLNNAEFGATPNITTYPTDETTPILKKLQADGISYGSYAQVNQQTVRVVPIDGLMPDSQQYPLRRQLSYIYKEPMSPAVKTFMDFLKSPEAQEIIKQN